MKKKYEKPVIIFESFKLDANIAGNCQIQDGQFSEGSCANFTTLATHLSCGFSVEMPGLGNIVLITNESTSCVYTPPGQNDSICYHVPSTYWNS